ncbi:MAG: hypothetical protein JWM80_2245 [Cyanobacteria bacterium RYN_339]|nr:hypothetical protein [Cyanobacteria bacterium RYN_339]
MSTPAFNIGLPVLPQQGVYTAPSPTPTAPGYPTTPGVNIGVPTDTYTGLSGTNMVEALGVGGIAGYKAPRGLQGVRSELKITKTGARSAAGRSYGRGNSYGGYRDNGYRNGYRSYNSRSYNGRSNGGRSRVGSAQPFGLWAAVKSSVIIGSLISVATNGWELYNKRETGAQAGANVAGDVASSAVGGAGGAVASYIGCGLLETFGAGGGLLTIAGIGLGIGGYFLADKLLRNTTIFKSFQSGVYKLFGGK